MDQIRKPSLSYEGVWSSQAGCKYLFHFGSDEFDSLQVLQNHSCKYFTTIHTNILVLCMHIHLQWLQQGDAGWYSAWQQ